MTSKKEQTDRDLFFFAEALRDKNNYPLERSERISYSNKILESTLPNGRARNLQEVQTACHYIGIAGNHQRQNSPLLDKKIQNLAESLAHFAPRHPIKTIEAAKKMALIAKDSKKPTFVLATSYIETYVKDMVYNKDSHLAEDRNFRNFVYNTTKEMADKALLEKNGTSEIVFVYKDMIAVCAEKGTNVDRKRLFNDTIRSIVEVGKGTPIESLLAANTLTIVDHVMYDDKKTSQEEEKNETLAYFKKSLHIVRDKLPEHHQMLFDSKKIKITNALENK